MGDVSITIPCLLKQKKSTFKPLIIHQQSNEHIIRSDPHPVWHYFEEICRIPRLSGHEKEIRAYLLNFAHINHLEAKEDEAGNVLITKPSAEGFENRKTVVLQSHMDMVGEKNADFPTTG